MRKLFLAIALIVAQSATQADQMYAVFRAGSHTNVDACYGNPANATNGDVWIPFTASNNDNVIQHYDYSGMTLVYNAPAVVTLSPRPDVTGFIADLAGDSTIPTAVVDRASATLPALVNNSAKLKAYWARVVASGALSAAVQTAIQTYAANRNMPLQ